MSTTLHPFTFQDIPLRGRILRMENIAQHVHTLHDAPSATATMLAEMLAAAALMVYDAEHRVSVNLQVQNVSSKAMAFAHCSREGHLKAYANAEMQATTFAAIGQQPDSHFAVTLDDHTAPQPYQSLVGLVKGSPTAALEDYFTNSVQTPTYFRVMTLRHPDGTLDVGAIFLQALPGLTMEDDNWTRMGHLLATLKPEELASTALPAEKLLTMLFAEDTLRLMPPETFTLQADDPRPRMLAALANVPVAELQAMLDELGSVTLTDQTSGKAETFDRHDLAHLLDADTTTH
ncbi:MAG: Hsp33 family molecular chaperone HslO [Pseudomonadaceae bacterium]|nr:Hsp33 family molecular chaperone HslO [Pseudomonadaceae bacterium]